MKSKEELKKLFENGEKPTQEEFWEWQDSYWHKDEKLPIETAGLYKVKGSVADLNVLNALTGMQQGDVYNLLDTGDNYVYVLNSNNTGEPGWDKLSGIDLANYVTLDTTQYVGGAKSFITFGGSGFYNTTLRAFSFDDSNPGIGFYKERSNIGTIQYDGTSYIFTTSDNDAFTTLIGSGFIKEGSNEGYVLTGGGGHKSINDFQTAGQYVRVGGDNTTGNNILLGWTGSKAQLTVDATTIGNLWHSGNLPNPVNVSQLNDYVTLNTPQNIIANKSFAPTATLTFSGNDVNSIKSFTETNGNEGIVAGWVYKHYNTKWKVGNKRGGSVNSLGYSFQFSSDDGVTYADESVLIQPDGNILTSNFGAASDWDAKVSQSQLGNYATLNFVEDSIDTTLAYTEATYVKKLENVIAVGFVRGKPDRPYFRHTNGTNVSVASENWVANNFASLNSNQTLIGENTFDKSPKIPFGIEPDDAVPYGQAEEIAQVRINYTFVEIIYKNSATDLVFNFGDYPSAKIVTITCKGNDFQNIRIENMPRGVTLKILNGSFSLSPIVYFDGGAIVTGLSNLTWSEFYRDQEGDIFISDVNGTNILF